MAIFCSKVLVSSRFWIFFQFPLWKSKFSLKCVFVVIFETLLKIGKKNDDLKNATRLNISMMTKHFFGNHLHPRKLTWNLKMNPGKVDSNLKPSFSGSMLVFGGVHTQSWDICGFATSCATIYQGPSQRIFRLRSKELGHWEKESRCSLSQNGPLPTRHRFFEKRKREKEANWDTRLKKKESNGYGVFS